MVFWLLDSLVSYFLWNISVLAVKMLSRQFSINWLQKVYQNLIFHSLCVALKLAIQFFSFQIFFGLFSGQEWKCLPWFLGPLGREKQAGTTNVFGGFESLKNHTFAKFLVSFHRKLHANYFGAKIRKIEPVI